MMVRLKNMVRIQVKVDASADVKRRFGRDFVMTEVLREVYGIPTSLNFLFPRLLNHWLYGFDLPIERLFYFL